MNPSKEKGAARRTMRVATVFTGAAALAVGGAPMAMAAAGPAPALHTGGQITVVRGCIPDVDPHWVHLYGEHSTGPSWSPFEIHSSLCFGYTGNYTPNYSFYAKYICGGNNVGWYSATIMGNGHARAKFHEGTTFAKVPQSVGELSVMHISGWSGSDGCYTPAPGA
jgi:hypothetical protein